jgi:hypothetical protein
LGISALAGWYGSSVATAQFGATDGDQTTGGDISFGLPNSANRALGLLATSSTKATAFGVRFINGTAITLNRMNLQFTGAVWRQSNLPKTLQFYYFIDPTGTNGFPISATAFITRLECEFPHCGRRFRRRGGGRHIAAQPDQFEPQGVQLLATLAGARTARPRLFVHRRPA